MEKNKVDNTIAFTTGIFGAVITFIIIYMSGIINLIVYAILKQYLNESMSNNGVILFDVLISLFGGVLAYKIVKGITSK